MSNIAKLRAEVMRAHKLAGDKARRVEQSTGAKVAGSSFDPRRDPSKVSKYNARQLRAYQAELAEFRSRNTQFVAGSRGTPIPKHQWVRYQNVQQTYNKLGSWELASVFNVELPGGSTIGEREATFLPEGRAAAGRASNRPQGGVNLDAGQIHSADALPMLEKRLRDRMSEGSLSRAISAQRYQMGEMLSAIGESDLIPEFGELTDKQFSTLWNYTDFPDFLSTRYESVKNMSVEEQTKTGENIRADIREQLNWAKKIK